MGPLTVMMSCEMVKRQISASTDKRMQCNSKHYISWKNDRKELTSTSRLDGK